jgi:transposase
MTRDLLDLSDWLAGQGVTIIAMESTGSYWKPVFNILEPTSRVLLVNVRHIKQVPGRKTDVKDNEWIAQLLQHGLSRPSFVSPRSTRELRDLTRQRPQLFCEKARVANQIHLEGRERLEDLVRVGGPLGYDPGVSRGQQDHLALEVQLGPAAGD